MVSPADNKCLRHRSPPTQKSCPPPPPPEGGRYLHFPQKRGKTRLPPPPPGHPQAPSPPQRYCINQPHRA